MTPDELIGHWSADHGYHSAMEDEWLMLRADATGWYAYLRPWYTHLTQFRWTRLDARTIRCHAYAEITLDESDDRDQLEHRDIDDHADVSYELGSAQRPLLDEPVLELRIGLPFCLGAPFALLDRDEPERDFLRKAGVQP